MRLRAFNLLIRQVLYFDSEVDIYMQYILYDMYSSSEENWQLLLNQIAKQKQRTFTVDAEARWAARTLELRTTAGLTGMISAQIVLKKVLKAAGPQYHNESACNTKAPERILQ